MPFIFDRIKIRHDAETRNAPFDLLLFTFNEPLDLLLYYGSSPIIFIALYCGTDAAARVEMTE
jgi:hypothetical protein